MKLKRLSSLLSLTVIFVLLVSLFHTVNVRADEETPPAPATEEPVQTSEDETAPETESAPATEEPAQTSEGETAPETESVPATEEPVDDSGSDSTPEADSESTPEPTADSESTPAVDSGDSSEEPDITIAEALEQAPEGTEIVVLNADGENEPLASQDAEDIATIADPVWCPDTQATPTPGANGCSPSFTTMTDMINWLIANDPDADGTIWIEDSYDSAAEGVSGFEIDGADYTDLLNHSLTLQGGWNGVSGDASLTSATATSSFTGDYLTITNWVGDVTLNNIFIDGADGYNYFDDYTAGLYIETEGSISLDQVTVEDSADDGAVLYSGGDITIEDSSFNENGYGGVENVDTTSTSSNYLFIGGDGLYANTDGGDVTLSYVAANTNAGDGALIDAYDGSVFIEYSDFNGNGDYAYFSIYTYFEFDDPDYDAEFDLSTYGGWGLDVEADGNITLDNVHADGNSGGGAALESYANLDPAANGDITITNSFFDGNGHTLGFFNGNPDNVMSVYPDEDGYYVIADYLYNLTDIAFCEGLDEAGTGLLGSGFFTLIFNPCGSSDYLNFYMPEVDFYMEAHANDSGEYNLYDIEQTGGIGLDAEADGNIFMNNVSVDDNTDQGAYLDAVGNITIEDSTFNGNGEDGYVELYECVGTGVQPCFPEAVDIGYNFYVESDYGNGLHADSENDVTLSNVHVDNNYDDGAILHVDGSVFIEESYFDNNGREQVFGDPDGTFTDYFCNGFFISLCGPLDLPFSEINFSFSGGIDGLDNFADLFLGVLIYADITSGAGLDVEGEDITLNNVSASGNMGDGALLDANDYILVDVDGGEFSGNGYGWNVETFGPLGDEDSASPFVLFLDLSSGLFAEGGIDFHSGDGFYADAGGDITLMGNFYADGNSGDGAEMYSGGNIFVYGPSSFSGNGAGLNLFVDLYAEAGSGGLYVDLWASGGNGDGLYAEADGDITLVDVNANENYLNGADLSSFDGSVFIEDSFFNTNGLGLSMYFEYYLDDDTNYEEYNAFGETNGSGLLVYADEDITLSVVNANGNSLNGADLYSDYGSIFVEESFFNGNGLGSYAYSNFYQVDNVDNSEYEENNSFGEYTGSGLIAYADGDITLITVNANGNSFDGANLESDNGSIFIADSFFNGNGLGYNFYESYGYHDYTGDASLYDTEGGTGFYRNGSGLIAEASADITLIAVNANGNSFFGADLYSDAGNIFVERSFFNGNGSGYYEFGYEYSNIVNGGSEQYDGGGSQYGNGSGLYASADGDVTLTEVEANGNMLYGADLHSNNGNIFVTSSFFNGNGAGHYEFIDGFYNNTGLNEVVSERYEFSNGSGLYASADGDITLTTVEANGNMLHGADLYSDNGNIFVTSSFFNGNGAGFFIQTYNYDLTGDPPTSSFALSSFNNGSGLVADAAGDITLSYMEANGNALYGAELFSGATESVVVGNSYFNGNGYYGTRELNVTAYENGSLVDDYAFQGSGSGLYIYSNGNVTLTYVDAIGNYKDGAEVYSDGGYVRVFCGVYDGNGYGASDGYGIYEDGASSLGLYGPEVLGNFYTPDEYYFSNSLILSDDCFLPVPVVTEGSAGAGEAGSCKDGQAHLFEIRDEQDNLNGDFVIFPCPVVDVASADFVSEADLPAELPDFKPDEDGGEAIYRSALQTTLVRNGKFMEENEGAILVSFLIPDGVDQESLSILFWNGGSWVDLGGFVSNVGPEGQVEEGKTYFKVTTFELGSFTLVTK